MVTRRLTYLNEYHCIPNRNLYSQAEQQKLRSERERLTKGELENSPTGNLRKRIEYWVSGVKCGDVPCTLLRKRNY